MPALPDPLRRWSRQRGDRSGIPGAARRVRTRARFQAAGGMV
nr:hypothetical protein [Moorena sp. SIO2C4]